MQTSAGSTASVARTSSRVLGIKGMSDAFQSIG